jgi:lysozyme
VGYGATGHGIGPGTVWTAVHAEANLRARFIELGARIDALVIVPLEAHELAALALFADNVGIEAFRNSTLLRKLNAGDRLGAANQFIRWNKANGRVLRGLTIRRAAERALFVGANA